MSNRKAPWKILGWASSKEEPVFEKGLEITDKYGGMEAEGRRGRSNEER